MYERKRHGAYKKLAAYLVVHILSKIDRVFVANLDVADVQGIDDRLNGLGFGPWGSSEGQDAEVGILGHQVSHDLTVRIVSSCLVRLVYEASISQVSCSSVW